MPHRRYPLALTAALLLASLASCTAARPAPRLTDPLRAVDEIRAREARVGTLRARFTALTSTPNDTHRTAGVLLVKKPDRFRLRLSLPFGITVFDYVSWGARSQVSLPLRSAAGDPPPDAVPTFSREDLAEAFLRDDYAFPGRCVSAMEAGAVVISCKDDTGTLLRQLRVDARTGAIQEETSFDGASPRLVLRYEDHRSVGEAYLPRQITMVYPMRRISVRIAIDSYELNPQLSDDLFQPVRPWGT